MSKSDGRVISREVVVNTKFSFEKEQVLVATKIAEYMRLFYSSDYGKLYFSSLAGRDNKNKIVNS